MLCLALNVFHEARGEPLEGKLAVALVTRNRALQQNEGVCWTVFKHSQFSWTLDHNKMRRLPHAADPSWIEAQRVANHVMYGAYDFTKGATHYHTATVRPKWARSLARVGQWGNHIFYKVCRKGAACGR